MKFENTKVYNFEGAFKGARNPLASWDKSDSYFGIIPSEEWEYNLDLAVDRWVGKDASEENKEETRIWLNDNACLDETGDGAISIALLGPNDLRLAQNLIKGGSEQRKFLRQIFVCVDITAPLYWWKELDTYKIGTTADSTSTMHKLASTPITIDCFETDDYEPDLDMISCQGGCPYDYDYPLSNDIEDIIDMLEKLRLKYNETQDKKYWKELVRWLPESWLQTRTWTCDYENLLSICKQRKNHKLTEWHQFIYWAKTLPYANELIFFNN